jgi:hypothetical protein
VIRSDESSFTLFPASGKVYVWRTPKEANNPECLVPKVKHGGRFYDGLDSDILVTAFCLSHFYSSWPNYCKGLPGEVEQSGASHDPDVISEKRCSFPERNAPTFTQLELFSHGLKTRR